LHAAVVEPCVILQREADYLAYPVLWIGGFRYDL
jgi:hypothetical protein